MKRSKRLKKIIGRNSCHFYDSNHCDTIHLPVPGGKPFLQQTKSWRLVLHCKGRLFKFVGNPCTVHLQMFCQPCCLLEELLTSCKGKMSGATVKHTNCGTQICQSKSQSHILALDSDTQKKVSVLIKTHKRHISATDYKHFFASY